MSHHPNPRRVPPLYRILLHAIEVARREARLAQWELDDAAGIADRSFPKLLFPEGKSGRMGEWRTISDLCSALFRNGYRIIIVPAAGLIESDDDLRHELQQHSRFSTHSFRYEPVAQPVSSGPTPAHAAPPTRARAQAAA